MKEIPEKAQSYKRTPEFNEDTIPAGLLKAHQTKEGTWGKINVSEGELLYRILEPVVEEVVLSPAKFGVVEPTGQGFFSCRDFQRTTVIVLPTQNN